MLIYKAQFISMIIMTAIGIGIFVGFNMEWVSIRENTSSFFEETGFADYRIVSETGFDEDSLEKIKNLDGVKAAAKYLVVSADIKGSDDSLSVSVTTDEKVSGFYLTDGDKYDAHSPDGIWLSDKYAAANDIKIGDSITLVYKSVEFPGIVKGLIKSGEHMICVRDESQLMPDFNTHGFAYISPEMYRNCLGFEYYPQINVLSDSDKSEFTEAVDKTLGTTPLILTKNETISYSGSDGEIEEGKTMGSILPVLFLLIAILTMVTTMHRIATKEKIQIGTLKALGFKNGRILLHYTSYALMIGVIGSLLGVALGYLIAWIVINPDGMMGTYIDMPQWKLYFPWFCYVVLAVIVFALTFIGFLSVKKMLSGTAADALRPYSPKKMKPMLIEKTRFFHRLPFGIRWNLRDIMRHKARTAMSLIGIVGCMTIMVGTLGMKDTMNSFLDLYYDGATNYSSRIYLSEDATDEMRSSVIDKYDGDWSCTVRVQVKEKAVSLDVFSITHDMVRFPDNKNKYVDLKNDGAYICNRIADEFSIGVGDTIKVSPYGSDKAYELKIAGVIRSVSESIVITDEYADSLGITYAPDSVYTDVKKADIENEAAIKSVQSKQMIMDSFDTFMELMNLMIVIFIIGAIVLGVVVLYNLGVMSYTERYREMATLKVVGFRDRKIGELLIGQNMWVTLVGALIGIPAGMGALKVLLDALASEYEMKMSIGPITYTVSIILTFGVSLLVSLLVANKNKKIDMVEALKGAE